MLLPRTEKALEHPIGCSRLRELARAGDRVCIVFTDAPRASPDHLLVPALLAELEVPVCASRMSRCCAEPECTAPPRRPKKLSSWGQIVSRYRVIDNEPQNPQALIDLGVTPQGVPCKYRPSASKPIC